MPFNLWNHVSNKEFWSKQKTRVIQVFIIYYLFTISIQLLFYIDNQEWVATCSNENLFSGSFCNNPSIRCLTSPDAPLGYEICFFCITVLSNPLNDFALKGYVLNSNKYKNTPKLHISATMGSYDFFLQYFWW